MTRALPGWWRRRRRFEQEKLAPVTDERNEQAKRTGQEGDRAGQARGPGSGVQGGGDRQAAGPGSDLPGELLTAGPHAPADGVDRPLPDRVMTLPVTTVLFLKRLHDVGVASDWANAAADRGGTTACRAGGGAVTGAPRTGEVQTSRQPAR